MITDIVLIVWSKTEEDNEKWYHYYVQKGGIQSQQYYAYYTHTFIIYLHQEIRVAFKTKQRIFAPKTTTKLIQRRIASDAINMKVTRKKYCKRAAANAHKPVTLVL